jgi:hypothetical protein
VDFAQMNLKNVTRILGDVAVESHQESVSNYPPPKSHPSSKPNIRKIFQCYSILSLSLSLSLLPSYSFSHHSIHLRVVTFTVSSLFPKARPSINKETVNTLPTQRGLEGKKNLKKNKFTILFLLLLLLLLSTDRRKKRKRSEKIF